MLSSGELLNAVRRARAHAELAASELRRCRLELEERGELGALELGGALDALRELEEELLLGGELEELEDDDSGPGVH